jgi:hypothetical protein
LLEPYVVLLDDEDADPALRQLQGSQKPDQPSSDDYDVR